MRFDDRLRTVLAQPSASTHDRAVRWRQLVELVARAPGDSDAEVVASAVRQIREESVAIEERVRVAAALAVASLDLPAELVATFAADRLSVAAPVLASARLTASEWKSVAAAANEECRSFIATMRSEQPVSPQPSPAGSEPRTASPESIPSISDVVARIERLRQSREAGEAAASAELDGSPSIFRWECNESGEIDWVEGAPRGALVGATIARRSSGHGVDGNVERAFASRAPFHDGLLELPADAAIGGRWNISGIPAFERSSGRFAGYRGIAERPSRSAAPSAIASDPNALRELAHEIKTPLNAIIGFAEIITGEYLGPAESRFRERANEIVGQARLLLGAIEDLDFAARSHASTSDEIRTNIGEVVERLAPEIRETAAAGDVEIEASRTTSDLTAAIEPGIAERLILRLCSAVIARASAGERLRLSVDQGSEFCSVSIERPNALAGLADDALFGTASDAMAPTFPLRLARGLAQTAGADVVACERGITLLLPRA